MNEPAELFLKYPEYKEQDSMFSLIITFWSNLYNYMSLEHTLSLKQTIILMLQLFICVALST